MKPLILMVVLANCSHVPPDLQAIQNVVNPFCIISCRSSNHVNTIKGNHNAQDREAKADRPVPLQ